MRVKSIALVDIETSGMDSKNSEIIYAHATILPANGRISTFSEYARPAKLLDESVERLTGITNKMLGDKRSSSIVKAELIEFIKDSIIIGSNKEYLEDFLGVKLDDFIDARELMKIELVSNHSKELKEMANVLGDGVIRTLDVQKRLKVPYSEASIIAEVLGAMRGER